MELQELLQQLHDKTIEVAMLHYEIAHHFQYKALIIESQIADLTLSEK